MCYGVIGFIIGVFFGAAIMSLMAYGAFASHAIEKEEEMVSRRFISDKETND